MNPTAGRVLARMTTNRPPLDGPSRETKSNDALNDWSRVVAPRSLCAYLSPGSGWGYIYVVEPSDGWNKLGSSELDKSDGAFTPPRPPSSAPSSPASAGLCFAAP